MVARMKAEQEAAAAAAAAAATDVPDNSDVLEIKAASSTAGDSVMAEKQGKLAFLKKLGSKVRPGKKAQAGKLQGSVSRGNSDDSAAAEFQLDNCNPAVAATAVGLTAVAVGAQNLSPHSWSQEPAGAAATSSHNPMTYAWYGLGPAEATEHKQNALACIDAALAAQTSTITAAMLEAAHPSAAAAETDSSDIAEGPGTALKPAAAVPTAAAAAAALAAVESLLPAPVVGDYARGPTGKVLLGFTSEPLLLAEGAQGQPVILDSQGNALTGPSGEQMVLLLGSQGTPIVDPHGRPVFVAVDPCTGRQLGVHPDGSIITVPAATTATVLTAAAVTRTADNVVHESAEVLTAAGGADLRPAASSNIKEPDSYAPSVSCSTSTELGQSAATTPSAAAAPAPAEAAYQLPSASQQHLEQLTMPASTVPEQTGLGAVGGEEPTRVPATLLLGPHDRPLLGVDNRPLIMAVDEEGVPLVLNPEGGVLLGPDDQPLQLAAASDGSLVALDSQCRPLSGEGNTNSTFNRVDGMFKASRMSLNGSRLLL
jgi:hypothetical protein